MSKLLLGTILALCGLAGPASAASQNWNVTEETSSGVKAGQGVWSVNTDPEGKIVGTANLQLDNGKLLTYTISGYVKDALYKIEMSDRSDGKNGCVWDGHVPAGGDKSHGLIGTAVCDGGVKLIVRAGF
jgi:hypothetical protein